MEAEFVVKFPKSGRLIHFKGITLCDEYDRLCFKIRPSDCTVEYQHLAGKSFIPNEDGVLKEVRIKDIHA